MMRRAIKIDDALSIIVTFRSDYEVQLTADAGLVDVQVIKCFIHHAKGLNLLGVGAAIRQPEDDPDDAYGMKRALGRALKDAEIFSKEERNKVFNLLRQFLEEYQTAYMTFSNKPVKGGGIPVL